jgi:uncharacterized protein YcaQ
MVKVLLDASRLASASRSPEMWWDIGKTGKIRDILSMLEKKRDLFSLRINGFPDLLYAPAEDEDTWRDPPPIDEDFVRFLAPLDPMLWNRSLFKVVFGMEYAWEVYKKPHLRKFGYYCLPILFNDRVVALFDPFYKKAERELEVRNFHVQSKDLPKVKFKQALERELDRFCAYLGAESVDWRCKHRF